MPQRVLILGGSGRIGCRVAADLWQHTPVTVTLTGRRQQASFPLRVRQQYQPLDLAHRADLTALIAAHDLTIHCAGPFRARDLRVLETCLQLRIQPYTRW
jgi:saccharopine dehydrogenase-like NADP-dependent oxidoreductase